MPGRPPSPLRGSVYDLGAGGAFVPPAFAAPVAVVDEAVATLAADGRLLAVNGAAEGLLGETAEALAGRSVLDVLRGARWGSAALAVADALALGLPAGHTGQLRAAHFTVHDAGGQAESHWHLHPLTATGDPQSSPREPDAPAALLVVRPAAPAAGSGRAGVAGDGVAAEAAASASAACVTMRPPPAAAGEAETLAAVARELARAGGDVAAALDELAGGALVLLAAAGACVVTLDPGVARVTAGAGSLALLRGHAAEVMAPPSLFRQAVLERRVVVTNDAERDARVDPRYGAAFGMRHVLVAPLVIEDAVAAVLCAVNSARGGFSPGDGALAQRLADLGALALRSGRLVARAERSAREAGALREVAGEIARSLDLERVTAAVAAHAAALLGARDAYVGVLDGEHITAIGHAGATPTRTSRLPLDGTLSGVAVRTGRPVRTADLHATPERWPLSAQYDRADRPDGRVNALAAPLVVGGSAVGTVSVFDKSDGDFDDRDEALLVTLASHAAVAVENARLYRAAERARAGAEAAAAIARVALGAADVPGAAAAILAVVERLVPSAGTALTVDWTAAGQSVDTPDGALECVAAVGTLAPLCARRAEPPARPPAPERVEGATVPDLRAALPVAWAAHAPAAPAVRLPLAAHGRVLGELLVATAAGAAAGRGAFDREALEQLAASVALALDALLLTERDRRQRAEERRLGEQLRQAEKMAALGELVAGVAHEINNPLAGISAFAELLLEEPVGVEFGPEQRDGVRLIKREADRAVGVVRDLLAFSREAAPAYAPLAVDALVGRAVRQRGPALRAAGVETRLELDDGLPPVLGDEAKLQQVLVHLLLNAEYAMRDAAVRHLTIGARRAGQSVRVVISDTGAGVPAAALARIFEPFFTTKPAGEGTGLGLSVSYGIVQAHGGAILVRSAPGEGATFEVVLPLAPTGGSIPALRIPASGAHGEQRAEVSDAPPPSPTSSPSDEP